MKYSNVPETSCMIVHLNEVEGLQDSVESLRSRSTAAAAAEELYLRRLKYTDSQNGWKYAVFSLEDGSRSYGKVELAALSNEEDDVPVEDVYGQVHVLSKQSLCRVNSEALYVCIHIAFLSRSPGMFLNESALCISLSFSYYTA